MPETPKEKCKDESDKTSASGEDRQESSYYYDDAHGYKEYDPKDEDQDVDEDPD